MFGFKNSSPNIECWIFSTESSHSRHILAFCTVLCSWSLDLILKFCCIKASIFSDTLILGFSRTFWIQGPTYTKQISHNWLSFSFLVFSEGPVFLLSVMSVKNAIFHVFSTVESWGFLQACLCHSSLYILIFCHLYVVLSDRNTVLTGSLTRPLNIRVYNRRWLSVTFLCKNANRIPHFS